MYAGGSNKTYQETPANVRVGCGEEAVVVVVVVLVVVVVVVVLVLVVVVVVVNVRVGCGEEAVVYIAVGREQRASFSFHVEQLLACVC